jgi:hypothetical protein
MVDEDHKRVMMCHATSSSMCRARSTKLTPQDGMAFHISIYVSCHVSIVSTSTKGWLIVDGQGLVNS